MVQLINRHKTTLVMIIWLGQMVPEQAGRSQYATLEASGIPKSLITIKRQSKTIMSINSLTNQLPDRKALIKRLIN